MRIASLTLVAFFAAASVVPAVTLAGDEAPKSTKVKHVKKHKVQRWRTCPAPKTCGPGQVLCETGYDPATDCTTYRCVHGNSDWFCPW
jgi:hypothetical protein